MAEGGIGEHGAANGIHIGEQGEYSKFRAVLEAIFTGLGLSGLTGGVSKINSYQLA